MKIRLYSAFFFSGLLLFGVPLFAQDSTAPKVQLTGMAAIEEGQFVKCNYQGVNGFGDPGAMPFSPWVADEYVEVGVKAAINRHFSLAVLPEIKLWDDTWDYSHLNSSTGGNNPLNQHVTVSLADAEGMASFCSGDALTWNFAAGVMPYKYDPEAKNLGEYLFRTGVHPAYVQTSFDQAYATLTGIRATAEIFQNFSVDLFLTTEMQVQPINDWSLSLLAGYKVPGLLDFGAGIMLDRVLPVSALLEKTGGGGAGTNTYHTSTGQLDTFGFGGTKLMARASFDPKGLLPADFPKIFGKEDGILYGEAAILGVQNTTAYEDSTNPNTGLQVAGHYVVDSALNFYSNILQRIPVMFGFNIPTFKLLDYLSVELEWYGWPYSSDEYYVYNFEYLLPQPTGVSTASHWKYSFNIRKTLLGNVAVSGQIARDHTRDDVSYFGYTDVNEIFQQKDEWGWWLKVQCNI